VHVPCGHRMRPTLVCDACGQPISARDVRPEPGPGLARAA
jgi:hypothetical protein